jgi:hypothetical protein
VRRKNLEDLSKSREARKNDCAITTPQSLQIDGLYNTREIGNSPRCLGENDRRKGRLEIRDEYDGQKKVQKGGDRLF